MNELFDAQNWIDTFQDEFFWRTVAVIAVGAAALVLALYSDRVHQLLEERRERAKWSLWND